MKNENDALKALGRRGQHSHEISRAPNPIIWRGRVDAQIHAVTAQDFWMRVVMPTIAISKLPTTPLQTIATDNAPIWQEISIHQECSQLKQIQLQCLCLSQ
jgi:hypothetical protein